MMNNSTIEALKAMRFSAMAAEFERQLDDPAAYSHLGFEERFALMVDAEWNRRQQNRLARCIREAHFATPAAMIEDIEYHEDRRLDKSQILRFATCKYIEDGHHIILKGASGSGKTFLACALGNAACRKYKSVRYIRLPELLEELSLAQASGELKKLIKSYRNYDADSEQASNTFNEFAVKSKDSLGTMNDMNEGINNISIAIEESAKGVTNVAQEISQLVTAISAITVQADENKNLSEDLSDEVAKFEKV